MQEASNVEIFPLFFGVLPFQQECPNQNGTALFKAGPVVALLLGCRRVVFFPLSSLYGLRGLTGASLL